MHRRLVLQRSRLKAVMYRNATPLEYNMHLGCLPRSTPLPQNTHHRHLAVSVPTSACSQVESRATAVRDDLMNRLNNALKQRDAAREEALLSKEELKKLQEDIESGALVPQAAEATAAAAAAASAAASATPAATPTPAPAPSSHYDPGRYHASYRFVQQLSYSCLLTFCCVPCC